MALIMRKLCCVLNNDVILFLFCLRLDLAFWYGSAFGAPTAHAQGAGWIQELIARLEHKPITEHRFSTNATLDDNPITFPLNQSLYVDATHEVVVLNSLYSRSILLSC